MYQILSVIELNNIPNKWEILGVERQFVKREIVR